MQTKRIMLKRSKEEKERLLLEIGRIGVVAGCRKHSIAPQTYYDWLEKYQASGISGLEDRRGRTNEHLLFKAEKQIKLLKEMLAEKELELRMKDELLKKKMTLWNRASK